MSKALTHLLLNWQQKQHVPEQGTRKFLDALVCGLGWSAVFKDGNELCYKHCSPLDIIPDFDDTSQQFDEMKYVCKQWYIPREQILERWKKAAKEIDFDRLYYDSYSISDALNKYSPTASFKSSSSTRWCAKSNTESTGRHIQELEKMMGGTLRHSI